MSSQLQQSLGPESVEAGVLLLTTSPALGRLGRLLHGCRRCRAAAQQLNMTSTSAPPQDARSSGA
eukprot:5663215-Alexandrium_andersonii.AAC.1